MPKFLLMSHMFLSYVSNSNPYVSSLIIVGAVVLYVTVILFGIDENITSYSVVNGFCQLRIWLSVIGFSLLFGTLFAKAWRIYYIFRHFKSNARKVRKLCYIFAVNTSFLYLPWCLLGNQ